MYENMWISKYENLMNEDSNTTIFNLDALYGWSFRTVTEVCYRHYSITYSELRNRSTKLN